MSLYTWLKTEFTLIEADIGLGVKYTVEELPSIAIAMLQAFLAGVSAGTPYATIGATALAMLESQGIKATVGGLQVALNAAESNLIEAGTPAPITVANNAAVAVATPLPPTDTAVVAAVAVATAAGTSAASS